MLGDIEQPVAEETEATFQPNRDHVLKVVGDIEELLQKPEYGEIRALDILVAVEAFGEHLRALLGVASLVAQEEANAN